MPTPNASPSQPPPSGEQKISPEDPVLTVEVAADAGGSLTLDAREHTLVWVALREHERKLREQLRDHALIGNKLTAAQLGKNADTCRELSDRFDAARFGSVKEASNG